MKHPKYFTDTLSGHHAHYWKLAAFEHFDQNADTILFSIPFPISQVPRKHKIRRPTLAPKVKISYKLPNHFDLKMRWFQNGNGDVSDKTIRRFSPTVLADSIRFTICFSAYFNFTISLIDIVNCFQNTMRSPDTPVHMHTPPWCREWFKNRNPNTPLSDAELLVVQLFNVCQGGIDAGML